MLAECTVRGLKVEFESTPATLSAPRVTHAASGQILVDYWGTGWFGTASLDQRGRLRLWIRRDRNDITGHVVLIDPARATLTRDYGHGRIAVQRPECLQADRQAAAGAVADSLVAA